MKQPGQRVLVVGAGALGLTCACHLQLAGADISFLVRPHRRQALSRPQTLYRIDDQALLTLQHYSVLTDPAELQGQQFDYVLLTLDGATCRSEQGVATLRALGNALAPTAATLLICGVGVGLYEHVQAVTGFSPDRLLPGTMKMLAYQVGAADAPQPPPEHAAAHDRADIAYFGYLGGVGFVVASAPKAAAGAFAGLYDRCGVSTCQRIPAAVYAATTSIFFPFTVASEIAGWQGIDALVAKADLWQLCCRSQREILRLKRHGLTGKLLALMMTDGAIEKRMRATDREASPIGFTAFNRFHHGGKVLAQNIQVLENCVAAGKAEGAEMAATQRLLESFYTVHLGAVGS